MEMSYIYFLYQKKKFEYTHNSVVWIYIHTCEIIINYLLCIFFSIDWIILYLYVEQEM